MDEVVKKAGNAETFAPEEITNKDLLKSWARFWYANEIPHTFDRMIAPAFLWGMMPILRKLYKKDEDLKEAYKRHLLFFNTQAVWGGGTLTGIAASLEESRAKSMASGEMENAVSPEMINNTKVGLMGALAGIGDAIDSGTVQYIFIAIALPWATAGSAMGALFPWIGFTLATFLYGFYFTKMGFRLGRNAAAEIVTGKRIGAIIDALSVLGLFMMGILAGSYVKVSTSLQFTLNGKEFIVQEILDKILPGMLPVLTVLGVYVYFQKKGLKITRALIGLTIVLGVLAAVGLL